ncbi:MAG TPA: ABC transporter substrate-binding protein [Candidatus Bathyarchaeota archaeon]|nr:ABC transporter substrate-binding protein [Candidatus Bathyarchaeota archaeon]
MKKLAYVLLPLLLIAALSNITAVHAQLPREETVYVSSDWGPPPGWNPYLPDTCWGTNMMYPALYLYSPYSDEWIPYVAESYRWIDKYTLEVKIRDEAKWWDGTPVTAYDVEYTLELGKKYSVPGLTPLWDYIEEVDAVDDKTVMFITSERKLNYLQMLGILTPVILPEHRWETLESEYGDRLFSEFRDDNPEQIVGAGPYKLMEWTEETYTYERVDDWWGKDIFGIPKPKYISHVTYKDNAAAGLAFETGELDVATHFFAAIYEMWEVKGLARRTYYKNPPYYIGGGVTFLWMNYESEGLDDPDVRRAIAHAIPFNDLISQAYYNYSIRAACVPIIHTSPAAVYINQSLIEQYGFDFDLDEAETILDDAGIVDRDNDGVRELPDGTRLGPYTIQVPYGWTDWMMMCDMISEKLGEIGIEVYTEFPDFSVWWQRLMDKDWDLVIGWADASPGYAHPWNAFRSTMDPRLSHPSGNWENYKNEEVIPLIDALPKESDPEKLMMLYSKLQEIWLRDLPGIPLFYGAVWYEYSEDYWVGWPAEENGWWFANFWTWPSNIPVWFYIAPKGETPTLPDWVTDFKFPTSELFEALAAAPWHGFMTTTTTATTTETVTTTTTTTVAGATTVTETSTVTNTITTTETATTTVTVPTMDVASVAGAGIIALIVGVAIGWIVGSKRGA